MFSGLILFFALVVVKKSEVDQDEVNNVVAESRQEIDKGILLWLLVVVSAYYLVTYIGESRF